MAESDSAGHADRTWAAFLALNAAAGTSGPIEWRAVPSHPRGFDNLTDTAARLRMTAAQQYGGDDWAPPENTAW